MIHHESLRQDEISIVDRSTLIQDAFRIEYMTIARMWIEAAVAIGSAVAANSLTLLAFGITRAGLDRLPMALARR